MQIFALANICGNRINYKLEITGLMGFHAIAVDRAIEFLSDRHHRTVSAWQNPPYFSTYLTYFSFSASISHPLPCFLSHLSKVHAFCSFLTKKYLHLGASSAAGHHPLAQSSGQLQYYLCDQWMLKCGSAAWRKTSKVEAAQRAVGQQSLAILKNMLEIFTINAFNQHDPEQKSIVPVKYFFKDANGSYFSCFSGLPLLPSPHPNSTMQHIFTSSYLVLLAPFLEKQLYN